MTKNRRAKKRRARLNADRRRGNRRSYIRQMRGRSDTRNRARGGRAFGAKGAAERWWRRTFGGIMSAGEVQNINDGREPVLSKRPVKSDTSGAAKRRRRGRAHNPQTCQARTTIPVRAVTIDTSDGPGPVTFSHASASIACGLRLRSRHGSLRCPIHGGAFT